MTKFQTGQSIGHLISKSTKNLILSQSAHMKQMNDGGVILEFIWFQDLKYVKSVIF